ncbi:hypothetical protein GIB67_032410 [Kingdonia uniflora]|uniref:Aminotransferase-like plant mobile domain-containing protein n=1 Tax=Kingdonia uniflora TaxID=39325 RepID=A0A7J7MJ99_9MAGN|nr:hypothetical protein GIB67_032410 [Kingdonia uniflora]
MANDTVPLGYLAVVADLDLASQYDWGSAILASLYYGLDTAVTTGGAITGFVQLLTYWFYEYCGVGHPLFKEDVKYHIDHRTVDTITWEPWLESTVSEIEDVQTVKLLSHPPLSMSLHISPAALQEMRQARFLDYSQRMGNINLLRPTALRVGIIPMVVTSALVHSLSQDFSLPGEAEGPDPGWYMKWTGRCEMLPIARLRDVPPMSSSYGAEELWHLTHGMRRLVLADSARDAQRFNIVAN